MKRDRVLNEFLKKIKKSLWKPFKESNSFWLNGKG